MANGQVSVLATVTKSAGIAVTLSPWLIHTSSSGLPAGLRASSMSRTKALSVVISTWA
ncbi:hypothetical protein D3C81_1949860 [compost metagenome]